MLPFLTFAFCNQNAGGTVADVNIMCQLYYYVVSKVIIYCENTKTQLMLFMMTFLSRRLHWSYSLFLQQ